MSKIEIASPEHEATYQELVALITRHGKNLTPIQILAIGANMIGKLIALQDQRVTSPELAMETVIKNIEFGNQMALAEINSPKGHA